MKAREVEEMRLEISRLAHRHRAKLGADEENGKDVVQDAICRRLL